MKQPKNVVKNTRKFGVGSIGLTGILLIIFAILGGIMGGLTGALVGILMILSLWVLTWVAIIPFVGIFWFVALFNIVMDYIYSIAPQMAGLVAQNAFPRIALFWLYVIMGSIACIVFSVIAVIVIIAGIAAILSLKD